MRLKATEMVGVQVTSREAQRLLDAIAEGKLGPHDDPELVALVRKLKVMPRSPSRWRSGRAEGTETRRREESQSDKHAGAVRQHQSDLQRLGPDDGADTNVAVMDDFIYGEPQPQ